jgi:hypothetical protein
MWSPRKVDALLVVLRTLANASLQMRVAPRFGRMLVRVLETALPKLEARPEFAPVARKLVPFLENGWAPQEMVQTDRSSLSFFRQVIAQLPPFGTASLP